MPAFYTRPRSIEDIVDQVVGRVLDHLGIETEVGKRWVGVAGASLEIEEGDGAASEQT